MTQIRKSESSMEISQRQIAFWLVVSTHLKNISQIESAESFPQIGDENKQYLKPPASFDMGVDSHQPHIWSWFPSWLHHTSTLEILVAPTKKENITSSTQICFLFGKYAKLVKNTFWNNMLQLILQLSATTADCYPQEKLIRFIYELTFPYWVSDPSTHLLWENWLNLMRKLV